MKKVLLLVVAVSLLLIACDSDLPPEPGAPGVAGNYYYAMFDWATEPVSFFIDGRDRFVCSGNEEVAIRYRADDQFVYRYFYVWDEQNKRWEQLEFSGSRIGNSNWLRGSSNWGIGGLCEQFRDRFADENDEIFAVAYTCRQVGSGWDCHGNRWQMQIASLRECSETTTLRLGESVIFEGVDPYVVTHVIGSGSVAPLPSSPGGSGGGSGDRSIAPTLDVDGMRKTVEVGARYYFGDLSIYVTAISHQSDGSPYDISIQVSERDRCLAGTPCAGEIVDGVCVALPDEPDAPGGVIGPSVNFYVSTSQPVAFNDTFTIEWNSNADSCSAYGYFTPLLGGGLWNNLKNLSPSGSVNLIAAHVPDGVGAYVYVPSIVLGIQCFDNTNFKSTSKEISVRVNSPNLSPGGSFCQISSWSPSPETVCAGQNFTQTSNCGTTRHAVGTGHC